MNAKEILKSKTPNVCIKHLLALNPFKHLLAASVGAFLTLCASLTADAQVYSQNPVGLVADMTTKLLTAPLTTGQRQALHANTFTRLPVSNRVLYLFAVAFEVGIMLVTEEPLAQVALTEYLQSASLTGVGVVASPELLAHKAVMKEAMRELNALLAPQVSNNATFQQAMDAAAIYSYDVDFGWDPN